MPHDVKGRLIERGDYVKVTNYTGKRIAVVDAVNPRSDCCNVQAAYICPGMVVNTSYNAKECELVMKADGSDPDGPAIATA